MMSTANFADEQTFVARFIGYFKNLVTEEDALMENIDEMAVASLISLEDRNDIKNLKLKLRPDEEHQYNSLWNIAADFDIDMSLSAKQIAVMLDEYEVDHQTGMNIVAIAEEIYQYTSGYPYLVSAIQFTG